MDVDVATSIVNSVGFPIAVCGALFWTLRQMGTKAIEMLSEFKDAINKNTNSINVLIIKLGEKQNVSVDK